MYNKEPYEKLSPNIYTSTDSGILVVENLREFGYHGVSIGSLFDLHGCKIVWKSLAQFHALSTKSLETFSANIDSLTVMDRCPNEWEPSIFRPQAEKWKEHVLPLLSDTLINNETLDDFITNVCPAINLGFSPNENGSNVIVHGDLHLRNLLLHRDENKCKFIDFQLSRRGSPLIDLIYFTIIGVQFEVFDKPRDELFDLYVHEFNSVLEQSSRSNKTFYTVDNLQADFEKLKSHFFFILIAIGPITWANDFKTSGSTNDEDNLNLLFKSEKYVPALKGWIKLLL